MQAFANRFDAEFNKLFDFTIEGMVAHWESR